LVSIAIVSGIRQGIRGPLESTLPTPYPQKREECERRLFCFITKNWRGRPLTSYEVIVNLIGSTTTKTGLMVRAALDASAYATGIEVSDAELARVRMTPAKFHGEWNYSIRPRN
jgi:Rhodopirellula transposase DDE domain